MSDWPSVDAFTIVMKAKLEKNAHKGADNEGWIKADITTLQTLMAGKLEEIDALLEERNNIKVYKYNAAAALYDEISNIIRLKCADVANYSMMIADCANRSVQAKPVENIPF